MSSMNGARILLCLTLWRSLSPGAVVAFVPLVRNIQQHIHRQPALCDHPEKAIFVRDRHIGELKTRQQQQEEEAEHVASSSSSSSSSWSSYSSLSRRAWFLSIAAGTSTAALTALSPAWAAPKLITSGPTVCDPSVSVWRRGNRVLYLQGTAHISQASAQLAGDLILQTHPNAVFIELDLRRLGGPALGNAAASQLRPGDITTSRIILDPVGPENTSPSRIVVPRVDLAATLRATGGNDPATLASANPSSSSSSPALTTTPVSMETADEAPVSKPQRPGFMAGIKQGIVNAGAAAVGGAIRGMYQNLGQAGFNPGEEFTTALNVGQELGADLVLGDRDVKVTLQRLTQALAVTDMDALLNPDSDLERSMNELLGASEKNPPPDLFAKTSDDEAKEQFKQQLTRYIETLKSRDTVRSLIGKLNDVAPELVKVMLTERDAYMAAGLDTLNEYEVITAVFGMAHQDGIERNLKQMGWNQVSLSCPRTPAALPLPAAV